MYFSCIYYSASVCHVLHYIVWIKINMLPVDKAINSMLID